MRFFKNRRNHLNFAIWKNMLFTNFVWPPRLKWNRKSVLFFLPDTDGQTRGWLWPRPSPPTEIMVNAVFDIFLPECYLCADLHLNIINLVNTSDHQIHLDVCWAIRAVQRRRSDPGIVNIFIQNIIKNCFFFQSLVLLFFLSSILPPVVDAPESWYEP